MRLRLPPVASLLAVPLLACSLSDHGLSHDAGAPAALDRLRIDPADATFDLAYRQPFSIPYRIFGRLAPGGPEIEVDAELTFSDAGIGAFTGSTFHATSEHGGKGTVTARARGFTGVTSLTLGIHADFADDGLSLDMIPAVLSASFDPTLAPAWSYPEEGVVIPPNLYGVDFSWTPALATDAFLFQLKGKGGAVQILTTKTELVLPEERWDTAVGLLGPGELVATILGYKSASPAMAGRAKRTFRRSSAPLQGAMYYWSSPDGGYAPFVPGEHKSAPSGYYRFKFDSDTKATATAELFLGFRRAGDTCVGCHAISSDGAVLATSFGTGLSNTWSGDTSWGALDVADSASPVSWKSGGKGDQVALGTFSAITPDGAYLFACDHATIRVFDLGASPTSEVATFTAPNPTSHIVVSPKDGAMVFYVEDLEGGGGAHVGRGRIAQIPWDRNTKTFGGRSVVAEEPGASLYYPSVSPDGAWLLYNRTTSGDSFSNPAASVWARRLDGSSMPIPLDAANGGPLRSNSWPRFTPIIADDGEGHPRYFLTFSSVRPHGAQAGAPQLWLATFDPTTTKGADPSTPALWLPIQREGRHNHAAQWAEVFVPRSAALESSARGCEGAASRKGTRCIK